MPTSSDEGWSGWSEGGQEEADEESSQEEADKDKNFYGEYIMRRKGNQVPKYKGQIRGKITLSPDVALHKGLYQDGQRAGMGFFNKDGSDVKNTKTKLPKLTEYAVGNGSMIDVMRDVKLEDLAWLFKASACGKRKWQSESAVKSTDLVDEEAPENMIDFRDLDLENKEHMSKAKRHLSFFLSGAKRVLIMPRDQRGFVLATLKRPFTQDTTNSGPKKGVMIDYWCGHNFNNGKRPKKNAFQRNTSVLAWATGFFSESNVQVVADFTQVKVGDSWEPTSSAKKLLQRYEDVLVGALDFTRQKEPKNAVDFIYEKEGVKLS